MLDLQAGVHLEERDRAVRADEELARAGADVAHLAQDRLRRLVQARLLLGRQVRRRGLLDELLVPTLQRAVARGDDDDVAVLVGQALGLDVARLVEVLLDEALTATERGDGLARRRFELRGDLVARACDLQATAAAAEGRLDGDRQTDLVRERDDLGSVRDGLDGARRERRADLLGHVARGDLVPELLDRLRRGADPGEPGVDDGTGEVGVLGEEPVAGVHGVGAGPAGHRDDLVDHEVGVRARGAVQRVGLVGEAGVEGVAVLVGVHRDRGLASVAGRADDADGDLAAVRDEDLADTGHGTSAYSCSGGRF